MNLKEEKTMTTKTTPEEEKMVETIQQVLAILADAYPERFRADGYTIPSTQVMGMFQQMLQQPTGLPTQLPQEVTA